MQTGRRQGGKPAVSLFREALFFSIFIGGGVMIRFGVNLPNHPGGDACRDGVGGDVLGDHGPGPDDGAVPDMYPRNHRNAGADPDVLPGDDGGGVGGGALLWVKVVVHGGQHHVVAQKGTVTQGDAALVLEVAAGVDKDPFAHRGVLAAVGVEGGERGGSSYPRACQ